MAAKLILWKWMTRMKKIITAAMISPNIIGVIVSSLFSKSPPKTSLVPGESFFTEMFLSEASLLETFFESASESYSIPFTFSCNLAVACIALQPRFISAITVMVGTPFLLTICPYWVEGTKSATCRRGTVFVPPATGICSLSKSSVFDWSERLLFNTIGT